MDRGAWQEGLTELDMTEQLSTCAHTNSEARIKVSSSFLIELEGSLRKAMEDNWTGRLELDCVVS